MTNHANRHRREFLRSGFAALGALTAAGTAAAAGVALVLGHTTSPGSPVFADASMRRSGPRDSDALGSIDSPAVMSVHADRLGVPPPVITDPGGGRVAFPIDPTARSYVLDNYGDCRGGGRRAHLGTDITSERGAAVYAVAAGRLTRQWLDTGTAGYGWELTASDGRRMRYFHLDRFAPGLTLGDSVAFGDIIGRVGSSGNLISHGGELVEDRTNIHLHLEIHRPSGATLNPLDVLAVPAHIRVGPPLSACQHLIG